MTPHLSNSHPTSFQSSMPSRSVLFTLYLLSPSLLSSSVIIVVVVIVPTICHAIMCVLSVTSIWRSSKCFQPIHLFGFSRRFGTGKAEWNRATKRHSIDPSGSHTNCTNRHGARQWSNRLVRHRHKSRMSHFIIFKTDERHFRFLLVKLTAKTLYKLT